MQKNAALLNKCKKRAKKNKWQHRLNSLQKNQAEGAAYLAENAKKEGVVTTDSGLQYKSLVAGDGEKPSKSNKVRVHYRGTLIDGTVFDSSYDRGEPIVFPVTGVIAGWVEGLQLMNVGSKFELTIPSNLAYGANGSGPAIGPDATLIFEVELLAIE
jgi:FKBP-type peptidyl-prolyl cis-trans isomerase FklB